MLSQPRIAIIGGGPCGLTLARLLECKGITYTVFERDSSATSNGAAGGSLDIHAETGQRALREAGLFEEFKKFARYDDTAVAIADKRGKRVLEMGQERDAPEIDRSDLRRILLESIPKDKIKWGHALASAERGGEGSPVLKFANGAVLDGFKLVVGADGGWSKVRRLVTQATPGYSGKTFLESRINTSNPLYATTASKVGPGMLLSIGAGQPIVTQRQGNGSYRIYYGLQVPVDFFHNSNAVDLRDAEATRNMLLRDFYADWADEYKDLIRHATDFRVWPLHTLTVEDMDWKSVPGVTLVGDAAHLAIPNGEGVNLAMTDALELASKIVEPRGTEDNFERAVREYEAGMFPRGRATIGEGWKMADGMFGESPESFLQLMGV
ncbi:FAD/NAD(P)-binding domain-containing protein [Cadophora sp. DSE1049]|nr:FAD/NAD(P)-binding domain-containing protein [Cadophora sp. DSE1049]